MGSAVPQRAKLVLPPKLARAGRRPLLPRVLTILEAALVLRVGHNAVRRLLNSGSLGGFRLGVHRDAQWLTTDLDLMAFMGFSSPGRPAGVTARRAGFPGTHISSTNQWAAHHQKMCRETQATDKKVQAERAHLLQTSQATKRPSGPMGRVRPAPDDAIPSGEFLPVLLSGTD